MNILNHLAQAAAVLLLLELLVVLLVFLALAGGLAFGLRWGRGKLGSLFEKVNGFLPRIDGYVHTGTGYGARPFIIAAAFPDRVQATAEGIKRRVRMQRPAPAATDVTTVMPAVEPAEATADTLQIPR